MHICYLQPPGATCHSHRSIVITMVTPKFHGAAGPDPHPLRHKALTPHLHTWGCRSQNLLLLIAEEKRCRRRHKKKKDLTTKSIWKLKREKQWQRMQMLRWNRCSCDCLPQHIWRQPVVSAGDMEMWQNVSIWRLGIRTGCSRLCQIKGIIQHLGNLSSFSFSHVEIFPSFMFFVCVFNSKYLLC